MNILHTLKEGTYAYGNLYLKRKQPVIVYAPGRVGSMGLIKNLRDAGVYSFKVESFIHEGRRTALFCKKHILNTSKSARVITLVRDPVSVMCSYYFAKCIKGWIPEAEKALQENNMEILQQLFISEVLQTERLDSHLYWFENDFNQSLKINAFEHPFDTKKQSGTLENTQFEILILRTELNDIIKSEMISQFLDIPPFSITRENVRTNKSYSEEYKQFKQTLSIPQDILEKIYTSPYATHFFSEEERAELIKKWS